MALPTPEEVDILEKFRGKVADILKEEEKHDDMFLLRWLRARDLDEGKAEEMLRNAAKWREENNVDSIVVGETAHPFYRENYPKWLDGIDKEGRPVFTANFGYWDVRKVVNQGKSDEFTLYLTECFEEALRALKRVNMLRPPESGQTPVTQVITIFDWDGFSTAQLLSYQSVQNFLKIASMYEAYYPEIVKTCYFINCPPLISVPLNLLKPVVAPKTLAKITCFGPDKTVWQEELLKYIDADQLRPQFGGTKNNDESPFL